MLTFQELLEQHPGAAKISPVLEVEADVVLHSKNLTQILALLSPKQSIMGLEVITREGESLGFIPSKVVDCQG